MLDPGREESPLGPDDFDFALRRMKTDLTLLGLRRQLLRPDLAAPEVLALVDRIVELQRHGLSAEL